MSTVVRSATEKDLDELAEILTDGFAEDPLLAWMFKTEEQYRRLAPAFFRWASDQMLQQGHAYIVDGKGVFVGHPSSSIPTDKEWDEVQQHVRNVTVECADNVLSYLNAARQHHPTDKPHWYGEYLAVRPEFRSEGIGVLLLRKAIEEHGPVYGDSTKSRNTEIYRRLGCTVVGSYKVGEQVEMTAVWWEASPS